jgi:transcriptional regulator with XRE-family HTH domain
MEGAVTAATKPTMAREQVALRWRVAQGEYIRELRIASGLTQVDLADAIGVRNKQMVSAIETGRINVPPERIEPLAEALGVNLKTFGRSLLRYQNPWLYAAIWGADAQLAAELRAAPERSVLQPSRERNRRP